MKETVRNAHTPKNVTSMQEKRENERGMMMIIGTCINGMKCTYDLPINLTAEQFKSLIYGYNNGRLAEGQREELYNQPKLLGFNGPMFNGYETLKSTGEKIAVIRYEKPTDF